jgi:hypothetical protein
MTLVPKQVAMWINVWEELFRSKGMYIKKKF